MKNVPTRPVVLDGGGRGGCVSKTTGEKLSDEPETEFCPSLPLSSPTTFRSFSFSRVSDPVHRYSRVQGIFARPPTTPPTSSRISIAKLINPSSVFPGGHPGNFAYPVHRKRAIPSAGRRRPLRFSPPHERGDRRDEEKERKKKERKGRGGEAREKEGRREREKKIRMERKTKRAVARSRGGEWTRGRAGVGRWR